jgi:hypothetical protein
MAEVVVAEESPSTFFGYSVIEIVIVSLLCIAVLLLLYLCTKSTKIVMTKQQTVPSEAPKQRKSTPQNRRSGSSRRTYSLV